MKRALTFAGLLVAFIMAVVGVRHLAGSHLDPQGVVAWLGEARASGWAIPAFALVFGLTSFLAPAFVFFVAAGAVWGFWPGWLIGWVVANAWCSGHFWVGRWLGGERVRGWLERRHMRATLEELEHGGVLPAMIVRQFPLPFIGVNLAAGASPIRYGRWVVGNALGLLPSATVYSYSAAAVLRGAAEARSEALVRTLLAAASIIALGVISRLVQRRFAPRGAA